jgi:hypothetical protein
MRLNRQALQSGIAEFLVRRNQRERRVFCGPAVGIRRAVLMGIDLGRQFAGTDGQTSPGCGVAIAAYYPALAIDNCAK